MRNLKRVLSLALALVMMLGMMVIGANAASADFADADEITNTEAVDVMVALGVIEGDGTNFNPDKTLTRAEAAKILCYIMMGPANAEKLASVQAFDDVPATHWASAYIGYCASLDILAGYGDGTFGPSDKLTGVAFGKMLLIALGYDPAVEGYVNNTNWATNIGTDMITAGLDIKGVNLAAELSRDNACQMAFQALTAATVNYPNGKGTNITLSDGTKVVIGADVATKVPGTGNATGNYDGGVDTYVELCEKYFPGLTYATGTNTIFNRPTAEWTYTVNGSTTKVAVAQEPDAVYTTAVKGGKIYSDLGLKAAPANTTVVLNGTSLGAWNQVVAPVTLTADPISANGQNLIGGNGVITEVYKLSGNNLRVVQIQYTLGYVNNVNSYPATSAKGAYTTYTIDNVAAVNNVYVDNNSQIGTYNVFSSVVNKNADKDTVKIEGTVAKGDYVLIVTDATATVGTTYIYPVTAVTGCLTASSATTYTIGGTAYTPAKVVVNGGSASFNTALYSTTTPVTVLVDSYNNVIAPVQGVTAAPNYVYVAYQENAWSLTGTTLKPSVTAYVVDTDGKISTMSVTNIGGTPVDGSTTDASDLADGLYTYRLNSDGTTYTFTNVAQNISSGFNYATSAVLTGSVYGNANTVFYTITCDAVTNKPVSVATTTGMGNMGNVTSATGSYIATNNVATHVFLTTAGVGATAKIAYYTGSYSFDGTNTVYDVIVNGAPATVKNTTGITTVGLYSISASNAATAINTASGSYTGHTGTYTASGKTYGLTNNGGLLSVVETVVATGVATTTANIDTVADSVPVYVISASAGTCTTSTAAGLSISGASLIYIQANASGTGIGAIYAIVA